MSQVTTLTVHPMPAGTPPAGTVRITDDHGSRTFVYATDTATWADRHRAISDNLIGGYDPWNPRRLPGGQIVRITT
jgi:hypothetical protein